MWEQSILKLIAFSAVGGVVCGVVWDFLKILRMAFGVNGTGACSKMYFITIFFHDFLFCIFSGCVVLVTLYYGNDGKFRLFSIVGTIVGFMAYRISVGALIIEVSKTIIAFVHAFFMRLSCFFKKKVTIMKEQINARRVKDKEAVKIEKNQNCKFVGNKRSDKVAFHKSKPRVADRRKKSA